MGEILDDGAEQAQGEAPLGRRRARHRPLQHRGAGEEPRDARADDALQPQGQRAWPDAAAQRLPARARPLHAGALERRSSSTRRSSSPRSSCARGWRSSTPRWRSPIRRWCRLRPHPLAPSAALWRRLCGTLPSDPLPAWPGGGSQKRAPECFARRSRTSIRSRRRRVRSDGSAARILASRIALTRRMYSSVSVRW